MDCCRMSKKSVWIGDTPTVMTIRAPAVPKKLVFPQIEKFGQILAADRIYTDALFIIKNWKGEQWSSQVPTESFW